MNFNNSDRPALIEEYFYLLEQRNYGTEANFSPELTRHQEEELSLIEEDMSSAREDVDYIKKRLSEPIRPFSFDQICRYLPWSIVLDFKKIHSIFILLNTQQRLIVILLSLIFPILLFSLIAPIGIVIATFVIFYMLIKFYYARRIYQSDYQQKLNKEYQARQETMSAIKQKKQLLIDEIENLKETEITSTLSYLQCLEFKIKEWLEEDEQKLIKRGLDKLKIRSSEVESQRVESELDREPIISLMGVTDYEVNKSFTLVNDRNECSDDSSRELLIRKEDFYEQKGVDGKYKYGVYEFVSIFLAENFLAYYRCYWNFVRGAPVDEETCEYLYDSIVSVKTQERSSLNQKNPNERRNYKQKLSITTMDGKTISFQIGNDGKEKINPTKGIKSYSSKIDEEAGRIRYWLRKRRVDIQTTKEIGNYRRL